MTDTRADLTLALQIDAGLDAPTCNRVMDVVGPVLEELERERGEQYRSMFNTPGGDHQAQAQLSQARTLAMAAIARRPRP